MTRLAAIGPRLGSDLTRVVCLALALVGHTPAAALAQESTESRGFVQHVQEYFITSAVYPQERGEVQLTTAPFFTTGEGTETAVVLSVEYGLTDRWQLEIEWSPYSGVKPEGGVFAGSMGDLELETQYSFMTIRGSTLHAAVGFGVTLPTGDVDLGTTEGFIEYEPSIAVARDFGAGRPWQLFGQLGLSLVQRHKEPADPAEREPAAHELAVNTGILTVLGPARLVAELNWATNRWNGGGEESRLLLTPGIIWKLPGTWELGVATSVGVSSDAPDFRVGLLLLFEFDTSD